MAGLEKTASTRALGAIGAQRCFPAASSAKLCACRLLGWILILPRSGQGIGAHRSWIAISSADPFQRMVLGPMASPFVPRATWRTPRSVIAQRPIRRP